MSVELFVEFVGQHMTLTNVIGPGSMGDPMEVIELMWPLMQIFEGDDKASMRNAPYDPAAEYLVDEMMERLAISPYEFASVTGDAAGAVLLERVKQTITVLMANAASNEKVIVPAYTLPAGIRQASVYILWLHKMELPFAPGTVRPIENGLQ